MISIRIQPIQRVQRCELGPTRTKIKWEHQSENGNLNEKLPSISNGALIQNDVKRIQRIQRVQRTSERS